MERIDVPLCGRPNNVGDRAADCWRRSASLSGVYEFNASWPASRVACTQIVQCRDACALVWRRWRWRHAWLDRRRCDRAAQQAGHGGWRATAAGASSPRRLSVRARSRRARARMDRGRRRSDRRAGVESNEIHARCAGHVPRSRCREDACRPGGMGPRARLRKKRHLKTGRSRGPGGLMRPRSASGTPVPAGLDSRSGVCPRGWLRCERPAPSPPRRRGGSRTLPRREVSSLAPSCHCAPALPGLFFSCASSARHAG